MQHFFGSFDIIKMLLFIFIKVFYINKRGYDTMKKVIKIVVIIIAFAIILLLIGILPDVIYHCRDFLKALPIIKNVFVGEITNIEYIKIMVGPLFSLVAIVVSILAFITAKSTGKIHAIKKNAQIVIATSNISKMIQTNMVVINKLKDNTGNIKELLIDKNCINDAAYLYGAKKISISQFRYFKDFEKTVCNIKEYHDDGKDAEKENEIKFFCDTYFCKNSVEYVDKLNELKQTLENIENEVY